ncbi:MAG: hypothetical protein NT062_06780 [Proteobacteria bacterium]|nr:hypothetical protein [Pseudomonadota bacterium]
MNAQGLALLTLLVACSSTETVGDRCTRGIDHLTTLGTTAPNGKSAKPSAAEQHVIDGVWRSAMASCKAEGFTQAQLECILAATDVPTLLKVGECPAIKAKKPSWLVAP